MVLHGASSSGSHCTGGELGSTHLPRGEPWGHTKGSLLPFAPAWAGRQHSWPFLTLCVAPPPAPRDA